MTRSFMLAANLLGRAKDIPRLLHDRQVWRSCEIRHRNILTQLNFE